MEYSESCAILLLCLLLPLGPLHVLLEGVVDYEQLLAGIVDQGQLLEGGVRHELLLARLGLYTTRLGLYAMNCCWLGWGCTPRGCTPRPAAG